MKEIISRLTDSGFYHMANEELADAYYPEIKRRFPEVIMVKEGIHQHFILTQDRKDQIKRILTLKRKNLIAELKGVNSALKQF